MGGAIWVTGAGVVSALGRGLEAHRRALVEGRSGVRPVELFGGRKPDPCHCGVVPRDVLDAGIDDSASDRATRLVQMALGDALADGGLEPPYPLDLLAGATQGNMHAATVYHQAQRDGKRQNPLILKDFLPSAPLVAAAGKLGIEGRCHTVSSACGSAAAALGQALLRLRSGRCERLVAGGFEALSPFVVAGFSGLRLLASGASRPFDEERDGLNPGEGAALLLLETEEAARRRGARPRGVLAGFGEALETYHHTRAHPQGHGLLRAMTAAVTDAGWAAKDVDLVQTHGTGTGSNDRSEYHALRRLLGDRLEQVPAVVTKPLTGHTFGASAAISSIFALLAMDGTPLPAATTLRQLDPEFAGLSLLDRPLAPDPPPAATLISALGFGGEAYGLALSRHGGSDD